MSHVRIRCRGYEGHYHGLNGETVIDVTRWKFLAASLTLGFQDRAALWQAGPRTWTHRLGLALSCAAFLRSDHGNLALTDDYLIPGGQVDASEKGVLSYWQGMVFAKLAAAHVLHIPWLMCVDRLEDARRLSRDTSQTGRRPDLVGLDDGNAWHIIEAKGYTHEYTIAQLNSAKEQAATVTTIDGLPPATSSACVTSLWKCPIEILLYDPPPADDGQRWLFEPGVFFRDYYAGLTRYIQESQELTREAGKTRLSHLKFIQSPYVSRHFQRFRFAPISLSSGPLRAGPPFMVDDLAWIGLPEALLEAPDAAPNILRRLFLDGPLAHVASDGVALLGDIPEWPVHPSNPPDDFDS